MSDVFAKRLCRRMLVGFLAACAPTGAAPPAPAPAPATAAVTSRTPALAPSAVQQMEALAAIKASRTPSQQKIDSSLYLALLHQRRDPRLASLTDFRFVRPGADGRLAVDVVAAGPAGITPVVAKVTALGAPVKSMSRDRRRMTTRIRLDDLEALAALPDVRRVRSAVAPRTHAVNVSEGDVTHGANEARSFFGVDGTGVKVCVISDGVDSLTTLQASGDLPPAVDILPGAAGSGDEGSAMLEIVHDLAPGASLEFATGQPDEATFAQRILDLAADGCDIIVDDASYPDESPFEDGPVAQSVNTVTAAGAIYFAAAGNQGNADDGTSSTWEGDFLANGTPAVLAGAGTAHDFGDGGQSIQVSTFGTPVLIWAEHYDLATGLASTDFDIYDLDGGLTTIFDASTNTQDGGGGDDFPIEIIGGGTFPGERLVITQFASGATSSVPMFNLSVLGGALDADLATTGAVRGHGAAAAAFSVAATPATSAGGGPYPGLFTAANVTEIFSSDGPRRIILDPTGAELTPGNRTSTGGVVRQKPDLTAADGVSTAAPGFAVFRGTSAAAAHAAAIAALVKSAVPAATAAEIRTALTGSAIDIEAAGADGDGGAGIVMAHGALQAAGATPRAFLAGLAAVPSQVAGDGDGFIEPNEDWAVTLPLQNAGGVGATAVSATLASSTPGISILAAVSTYPDIATGASASNDVPYVFHVGAGAACGGLVDLALTVVYTGGASPQTLHYTLRLGGNGTPVTISYVGPPVPIPDAADLSGTAPGAPADAVLPVSGVGPIYDLDVRIDGSACTATAGATTVGLDHSFINDLQISLISPAATSVVIINHTDGGGNNLCQTVLDDQSAGPSIQSVATGQAPFTGSFTPNQPLAAFASQSSNGNWTLRAQDFFSQDTGNIRAWSLIITPAVCDAPVPTAHLTAAKSITGGDLLVGGTVTYAITVTNDGNGIQADNPGNELTDVLPSSLTLISATASSGTAVATAPTNTVTWNGAIAGHGGSVTIVIGATINAGTGGTTISNQASISYDSDGNGTNDAAGVSDDPAVGGASDPTSFTVLSAAKMPTETSLESAPNPSTFGAPVTFTATVSPAAATGVVSFAEGGTELGTANLSEGVAILDLGDLDVGGHSMTARYVGDGVYATSTSEPIDQIVHKAATTTTLVSSANPSLVGSAITLTATVTPVLASGNVAFSDGHTLLGTGVANAGVATLTLSTLTEGTHSLTASAEGNRRYLGSTSPAVDQVVSAVPLTPTVTALTTSADTATFGGSITLTATVTPAGATGTVTFEDGADSLGTGTLTDGTATLTTGALGGGSHSITAAYGGDASFAPSDSTAVSETIVPANTTATLTSSANPAQAGASIDFTVTISSPAGTPSGTVTLLDGADAVVMGDLVKGATTLTTMFGGGTHALTVAYAGDADFAASVSSVLSQVVAGGAGPDAGTAPPPDAPSAGGPDAPRAQDAPARDAPTGATADAAPSTPDAPTAEASSSSGCGCQTGHGADGSTFWLILLGLAVLHRARKSKNQ